MTPAERTRVIRACAALAIIAAGGLLLLALAGDRIVLEATGFTLLGLACVLAVTGVFYLIGRSEDRERGNR